MDLFISIVAILTGFVLLVWGADRFVYGAAATARNLGVPTLVIGLTVVGFGTSAPEILVSVMAAFNGNPGLAVGNAIGSNITNIGLVLGVTALVTPLMVNSGTLRREFPMMLLVSLLALVLVLDLTLSTLDSLILLSGLVLMLVWLIRIAKYKKFPEPMQSEYEREIPIISLKKALFWTLFGLIILLLSSRMLVYGAVNIATMLGVSDLIIGLTIVAIGTSLPELAASVMSALKKEHDIAIGNILGSNMYNLLAVLSVPGLIAPISLDAEVLNRDFVFMIGLSIALFIFAYGIKGPGRINRLEGFALLGVYVSYIVILYTGLE
jgi:cation:H+ antiporter